MTKETSAYHITPLPFDEGDLPSASTPFGDYSIHTAKYLEELYGEDEGYEDEEFKNKLSYCFDEYYDEATIGEYDTLEEAIEAANQHWIERISGCLTEI